MISFRPSHHHRWGYHDIFSQQPTSAKLAQCGAVDKDLFAIYLNKAVTKPLAEPFYGSLLSFCPIRYDGISIDTIHFQNTSKTSAIYFA